MRKFASIFLSMLILSATFCFAQYDCVYISGFTRDANGGQNAAYWKSGRLIKLPSPREGAEARTIAVSGNDVHVGGFKNVGSKSVATYWKNGVEIPLVLEGNYYNDQPEIYAIKTVGSDVYMFVSQPRRISSSEPAYFYYYKNGKAVKILLSEKELREQFRGTVRGRLSEHYFVTQNGDVYEAGVVADYDDGRERIVYWKNGHRVMENASEKLQKTNAVVSINSIYVSNNGDVYIAGNKPSGATASETKVKAVYWRNGKEVVLSYDAWNTYAKSIFVDNGNVYVAGDECKTFSHFSAVYWKNGQKIVLQDYDDINVYDATCTSVAVVYGTVYAAGSHKGSVYWVNGKEAKLEGSASTSFGAMAVVKGGGCFNNTTSIKTTTSPTYQSNNNNQVKQPQQQQSLTEDVKQLATGISGLMASFRADKERRIAEEKQAAIAKSNAERQLAIDAENGNYDAQIKMADKYLSESKYNLAQDYYFQAFQNNAASYDKRNDVLDELITTLSLQGKKKEIFDLFTYINKNKIVNYKIKDLVAFLQLNCDEFCPDFLKCDDSIAITQSIQEIKPHWYNQNLPKFADPKDALYAYLQVIGKYEKYGIPKDEKLGLKTLEKIADEKYPYLRSESSCAYYHLGLIYLNGTSDIEVNEKKALKYFKKGYDKSEKTYRLAPYYSIYDGTAYFNYYLLNYIKIAELYSVSEDKDDSELGKKMLRVFYKYYGHLIPNSDMEYFKDYVTK